MGICYTKTRTSSQSKKSPREDWFPSTSPELKKSTLEDSQPYDRRKSTPFPGDISAIRKFKSSLRN